MYIIIITYFFYLVPPKVISSTSDVVTREGETVTLVCNVTGVPPPRVQWYRQPLGQSPGKQKERKFSFWQCNIFSYLKVIFSHPQSVLVYELFYIKQIE